MFSPRIQAAIDEAVGIGEALDLDPATLTGDRDGEAGGKVKFEHKYLGLRRVLERKAREIAFLKLDERAPCRLLDLGAGGGHFCLLAKVLGHDAVPFTAPEPPNFGQLATALGLKPVLAMVRPANYLPVDGDFDLICASRITFNVYQREPWLERDWRTFLALARLKLRPGGGFYFAFNGSVQREVTRDNVVDAFRRHAADVALIEAGLTRLSPRVYVSPHLDVGEASFSP